MSIPFAIPGLMEIQSPIADGLIPWRHLPPTPVGKMWRGVADLWPGGRPTADPEICPNVVCVGDAVDGGDPDTLFGGPILDGGAPDTVFPEPPADDGLDAEAVRLIARNTRQLGTVQFVLSSTPEAGQGSVIIEDSTVWKFVVPPQDLPLPAGLWDILMEVKTSGGELRYPQRLTLVIADPEA